jgi:hypothetical protein
MKIIHYWKKLDRWMEDQIYMRNGKIHTHDSNTVAKAIIEYVENEMPSLLMRNKLTNKGKEMLDIYDQL